MPAPTTKVGEITIIPLSDGTFTAPKTELFPGTTEQDWQPYSAFLNDDGQMLFNLGAFLVNDGREWTLVDTGVGGRGGPGGRLLGELERAGVRADQIRRVIFTHLHFDHIGWNTVDRDGQPQVLFTNARHIVQRREWQHFTQPDVLAENPAINTCMRPVEAAGLLDLVDGDATITDAISAIFTPGHTPGHQSVLLRSGGEGAVITGDVTQNQVQLPHPDWSTAFDGDAQQAAQTRAALLDRIEQEGLRLCAGHYRYPSMGQIVRVDGKRWWQGV